MKHFFSPDQYNAAILDYEPEEHFVSIQWEKNLHWRHKRPLLRWKGPQAKHSGFLSFDSKGLLPWEKKKKKENKDEGSY